MHFAPRPRRAPAHLLLLLLIAACSGGGSPEQRPSAISATPPSGTASAPVNVTFSADATPATAQEWFVDGVPAGTGAAIDHTFDTAGQFEVRLEVTSEGGEGGTDGASLNYTVLPDSLPSGAYDIVLVFQEGAFTAQQRAMIQAAAERWEELVAGDIPDNSDMPESIRRRCLAIIGPDSNTIAPELRDVDLIDDLLVYVHLIDERTQTLARAGPCYWNGRLPNYGNIQVNLRHLEMMTSNDALTEVMIHEMAHILGVGTLWRDRATELLRPSLQHCDNSGLEPHLGRTFVGAAAVNHFQALGGAGAPPLAQGCGHWKQDVFGNESLTPARTIGPEDHTPLSRVTLGSLADLGYVVDYAAADPYTLPVAPAHLPREGLPYHHGEPFVLLPGL